MTTILITFFSLLIIAVVVTVATLPWWFARSMYLHRFWRMRDRLVEDILDEKLPVAHPAVQQLLRRAEFVLGRGGRRITMLDVIVVLLMRLTVSRGTRKHIEESIDDCPLDGLTDEQSARVDGYRSTYETLVGGSTITGSWLGLAVVALGFIPAIVYIWRELRRDHRGRVSFVTSASQVTDIAVQRTHLVRPSQELYRKHESDMHAGVMTPA